MERSLLLSALHIPLLNPDLSPDGVTSEALGKLPLTVQPSLCVWTRPRLGLPTAYSQASLSMGPLAIVARLPHPGHTLPLQSRKGVPLESE